MSTADSNIDQRKLDVKFAGGLAWTAGVKWLTQIFTWASLLIVARQLSPSDYGVGEMAGTLAQISNVLAEFGVGTAVLHMPELSRKTLAQLHSFSCILGVGVFLLAALASPLVAVFYHSDHWIFFAVNCTQLLITGIQAVPLGLLARDMDYRRLSLMEAVTVLVQSAVTIVTACLGWGYWALFTGAIAGRFAGAVLVASWKHVGFAWPKWQDIRLPIELGRQTAIGRLAGAMYTQADIIVVGSLLGESVLGSYRMAMNLASAPAEKVSSLLMRTATPLFANVKDDHIQVRRYYLILTEILGLLVMPMMVGLAIVAPEAIAAVFGPKWLGAAQPVRWLAIFMVLRTLGTLTEQVLISQKLTRFTMRISILNFVVMPLSFLVGARMAGLGGVASAWVLLAPFTVAPLGFVLFRYINIPYRVYLAELTPAITGSVGMCIVVLGLRHVLQAAAWPPKVALGVLVATGGAVYAGIIMGFFREKTVRYVRFFQELRRGRKSSDLEPDPVHAKVE